MKLKTENDLDTDNLSGYNPDKEDISERMRENKSVSTHKSTIADFSLELAYKIVHDLKGNYDELIPFLKQVKMYSQASTTMNTYFLFYYF